MSLTVEIVGAILAACSVAVSVAASSHVVLYKRDSRAATAWTGLIWLAPFVGAFLYVLLGINRIERRAKLLRTDHPSTVPTEVLRNFDTENCEFEDHTAGKLRQLSALVRAVTSRDLTTGNNIRPLVGGDQAYQEMLEAIRSASQTIGLSTYIFDADEVGLEFAKALKEASQRGVEVRVLIDAIGASYAFASIVSTLEKMGVPVEVFNPPRIP